MKKVLAMMLTICMVMAFVPAISFAADTTISAVRTAYFNSNGNEWKASDGDNILVSAGATGWTGATSFTDTDGTVTTQTSLSGTGFGSARNAVVAFTIPADFDPDNTAKVTLSMKIKNVKQTTAGARLSVYGNSVSGSWSTSSSTSIFGVSGSNSGLTSLPLLGLTDALTTGNQTGESASNETITLSSQKLTEYVCQMAEEGKTEVTFRLACTLGGIRIFDTNTSTPPTLTIEEGKVTTVKVKTVYMDGEEEVSSSETEVTNIITGTTYNYTGTPAYSTTIGGVIYTYSAEDSTLSTVAAADGSGEIVLVYNKYDESQTFSGYEVDDEGAWCWFADPRSISYANEEGTLDFTIMGYIDIHGNIKATQIDHLTDEVDEVLIRTNIQPDDHNNPTFLVLPDERIIVFYSRHTDEACFWYRVTEEKGDLTTLGEEKCLNTSANTTYPSPFLMENDPDHIYLMWRGIGWHPTIAKLSIPDENGDTEFTYGPYQMVQSTGARPYAKYASNGVDKLYVTYTTGHPDNEQPNWVYFNQIDIETMTLEDINGNIMSTIADGALNVNKTNTAQTHIVDTAPGNMRDWVWQTAVGEDGLPVIAMVRISGGKTSHDYYYVKWNGTEWVATFLSNGGGHFHQTAGLEMCYSGGMAIDPDNTNIMYCSEPVEGVFGKVYEIVKYTMNDAGTEVVSREQITKNSQKNNVRPYVIGNSEGKDIRLTWMNGDYYDWIVSNSRPLGYCTRVMAEAPVPTKTVNLANAVATEDYTAIDGAFRATKETWNVVEAEIEDEFTVSADIYLEGDYEGQLLDLGNTQLMVETWLTQYGATQKGDRARLVLFADNEYHFSSNVYGTSDCWTTFGRGTGGNYGVENYQGYVNLTITYDGEYVTVYRDGLVDIKTKAEGLAVEDVAVGGFVGLADNVAVYDRVLNHDEIKALAVVDEVTEPDAEGSVVVTKTYVDVDGTVIDTITETLPAGTEEYNFVPEDEIETADAVYAYDGYEGINYNYTVYYYKTKEYGENVMTNGSFEDENGDFSLEGWLSAQTNAQFGSPYSTNYGYAVNATEAISNNTSQSLTTTIPDGNWALGTRWNDGRDGLCSYKRYVAVEVGKTYEISYMAKHKSGADGGYIITSLVANEGDGEANTTNAGYIGTEWTRVTRTFTATEDTDYVLFWFRWLGDGNNTGNGPYWFFDDFSIREVSDVEVATVTVDGESVKTYGIYALGNADGTLPENVVGYYVTSGEDTKFVGAGELTVSDGDVITTTYINVEMVTGAQVRYGGGLDENGKVNAGNGLRFIAQVDRSSVGEEITGYGIEISAEGSSEVADIPATKWQDGDSQTIFTAAITDLAVSNYNRNFTAKPYVNVKYTDGTKAKIYSTETITRSIYAVAAGLLKTSDSDEVDGGDADYSTESHGLYNVLNAYVNMVGVRLNMTESGVFTARTEGSGSYTGDIFFDVASEKKSDGVYEITVTPVDTFANKVTIMSYWNEFVRINNNHTKVAANITDSVINEDGSVTFTFTVPQN